MSFAKSFHPIFFTVCFCFFSGVSGVSQAATYSVNTTLDLPDADLTDGLCAVPHPDYGVDVCTLRAAVMQANHEDHANHNTGPHYIILLMGTYHFNPGLGGSGAMSGDLDIETNIVIGLANEGMRPVIDAGYQDRIFEVHTGKSLRIGYLDLRHGRRVCDGEAPEKFKGDPPKHVDGDVDAKAVPYECDDYGGAILMHRDSHVYLDAVHLYENEATLGGAIYNQKGTLEMVYGTTLSGNVANLSGGAIASDMGQIKAFRIYVRDNTAAMYGGGIYLNHGNLRLNLHSEVSGNRTTVQQDSKGGGIYATHSDVVIQDSTLMDNETPSRGGGAAFLNSVVGIYGSSFHDNLASDGGGLFVMGYNSHFFMQDSEVTDNEASRGGGIYFRNHGGSSAWFDSSSIARNLATSRGGGLYLFQSLVELHQSHVVGNNAFLTGGGIELFDDQDVSNHLQNGTWNSRLVVRDSLIEANETQVHDGGGIHVGSGRNLLEIKEGTILQQNVSGKHGGALAISGLAVVQMTNAFVTGNHAEVTGGGIRNQGYLVISSSGTGSFSEIRNNTSRNMGAGIFNMQASSNATVQTGTAEITDTRITGNHSYSNGGGIAMTTSSTVNLEGVDVTGNEASFSGGGIYNFGGQFTGIRVSVIGNTAHDSGGGFLTALGSSQTTLKNSTLAQNQTGSTGGAGLMTYAFATTDLINVTVTENTSGSGAGGLQSNSYTATVNLKNTIVAGNTGQYADCLGDFISLGHNLIGDLSNLNCDLVPQSTDLFNVSADLLTAVNALEPGQSFYPLGGTSPAIDNADDSYCHNAAVYPELAEDQVFCPRVFMSIGEDSICDIGAAEY